jgi:hypothetical protein
VAGTNPSHDRRLGEKRLLRLGEQPEFLAHPLCSTHPAHRRACRGGGSRCERRWQPPYFGGTHSNTALSPLSERMASIRAVRPYWAQWARASSAACGRVIPAIGTAPPIELPATVGPTQPDSAKGTGNPINIAMTCRVMIALSPFRLQQLGIGSAGGMVCHHGATSAKRESWST